MTALAVIRLSKNVITVVLCDMPKKRKFWILGISALLSMGTTQAQNDNDSIPNVKEIIMPPATPDKPQVPAIDWYSPIGTWLQKDSLINFVSENLPFVKIENFAINSIDDFENMFGEDAPPMMPAQYNLVKNEVTIRLINSDNFSAGSTGPSIIHNEEIFQIKKFIQQYNKMSLACLAHELRHCINANTISLYGLTGNDIALLQVYDEISARIEELLLRRKIFIATKSINETSSDYQGNYSEKFKPYYKYLRKNGDFMTNTLTQAEADIIINCAIKRFTARDAYVTYQKNIPGVIQYKLQIIGQKYIKTENKSDLQMNNMSNALNQMFTFHNCNILEIASPKVVEALHKEMVKFIKKSNSKELQLSFNIFNPVIDSWATIYPVPALPTKDKTTGR